MRKEPLEVKLCKECNEKFPLNDFPLDSDICFGCIKTIEETEYNRIFREHTGIWLNVKTKKITEFEETKNYLKRNKFKWDNATKQWRKPFKTKAMVTLPEAVHEFFDRSWVGDIDITIHKHIDVMVTGCGYIGHSKANIKVNRVIKRADKNLKHCDECRRVFKPRPPSMDNHRGLCYQCNRYVLGLGHDHDYVDEYNEERV